MDATTVVLSKQEPKWQKSVGQYAQKPSQILNSLPEEEEEIVDDGDCESVQTENSTVAAFDDTQIPEVFPEHADSAGEVSALPTGQVGNL
jgi:hypothetical protein